MRFIKNEDRQRMSISKTKLNYLSALASVTCMTAALGALVFYFLLPEHYFNWYPFIPIYFFVLDEALLREKVVYPIYFSRNKYIRK